MSSRDSRNDVIVRLPAYEPAGAQLELSLDDLTRHVCLIGSTGSGKTTSLLQMVQQIIAYKAHSEALKPALLILDGKTDETASRVLAMAKAVGRESDVRHLNGDGSSHYNLFTGLEQLSSSEELADRLLLAISAMSLENAFWSEQRRAVLETALLLLSLECPGADYNRAVDFLEEFLLRLTRPNKLMERLDALVKTDLVTKEQGKRIRHAIAMADYWFSLHERTRSNVKSCLVPLFQVLASPTAGRYFDSCGKVFDPALSVDKGHIQVISANAVQFPLLAKLLFRMTKESFFDALHNRIKWVPSEHRLAVVVCDEWPLVVTPRDTVHLSTCRSKGGSFLVATQGLAGMDQAVGAPTREAMLANMNAHILFRSTELEVGMFATRLFGTQKALRPFRSQIDVNEAGVLTQAQLNSAVTEDAPVCPPGRLASLETHEAFVALGSKPFREPLWLVPDYGSIDVTENAPVAQAYGLKLPEGDLLRIVMDQDQRMAQAGFRPRFDADDIERLLSTSAAYGDQIEILRHALCSGPWSKLDKESISSLPAPWLKALNGVLPRLWSGRVPARLSFLAQWRGRLVVLFTPNTDNAAAVRLAVQLKMAVSPSVYRIGRRVRRLVQATYGGG